MRLRQMILLGLSAVALTIACAGNAAANLVVNGDFSVATPNVVLQPGSTNPANFIEESYV
jgi:hypothetical protein